MEELPEIVKRTEQLLAEVTMAVKSFARESRYGYGQELSKRAVALCSVANRTWREAHQRRALLDRFIRQLDDFKTWLRLGKQIQAFRSFAQFEALARTADSVGRQAGGWRKKYPHPSGQNPSSAEAA